MFTARATRALVVATVLQGCDDGPSPPARPPRPRAVMPSATTPPAASEGPSLLGDAGVPEAVARCVARARAATPDALRGALEVLDEPTLLDAACRLELAPRLRAPELCAAVSLSSLRDACLLRAAMSSGRPERCPLVGRGAYRDPVCVAIAARDLALCAAAGPSERVRCEALGAGDPAVCARLDPLLRDGCGRDLRALRGLLPRVRARTDASTRPSFATLACGDGGAAWRLDELLRGALLDDGGAWWILPSSGRWPPAWSLGGDGATVALRVEASGRAAGDALRADAVLELPGLRPMRSDDGSLDARVTLRSVPRRRGERVRADLRFTGTAAGVAVRCEGRVDLFVRDVVPRDAIVHHRGDAPLDR